MQLSQAIYWSAAFRHLHSPTFQSERACVQLFAHEIIRCCLKLLGAVQSCLRVYSVPSQPGRRLDDRDEAHVVTLHGTHINVSMLNVLINPGD